MGAFGFLKNSKFLFFIGGLAAGTIGVKALKSKSAKKLAVAALAKGMEVQDSAKATFATIKEDAQDLYAEAKTQAAQDAQPE